MTQTGFFYLYIVVAVVAFFVGATLYYLDEFSGTNEDGGLFFAFAFSALWPLMLIVGIVAGAVWVVSLLPRFVAKTIYLRNLKRERVA
jgi:hypothetical protein